MTGEELVKNAIKGGNAKKVLAIAFDDMMDRNLQLTDALETLVDYQNGPPLLKPSHLEGWTAAMKKANELLGRSTK